ALAGGEIPKDFEEKVKKMETEFFAKRNELNMQNIARLSADFKGIFTKTQVETAAKLAKDSAQKRGQPTKGTDTQWFNDYIVNVFINNPRIVPLLKEMRTANAEKGVGGNGSGVGGGM